MGIVLAWLTPRARRLGVEIPALLLLFAFVLLFLRGPLLTGRVYYEEDTYLYYYPTLQYLKASLDQGELPIWTPYLFGGFPLVADGEAGMLYPPTLAALRVLPTDQAYLVLLALRCVLAAAFMFVYLRTIRLDPMPAAIGGLVFTLGSALVTQIHHVNVGNTAIWLPLSLASIEVYLSQRGLRRFAGLLGAGAALGLAFLGVHPQIALMVAGILGAYTLYRILTGPASGSAYPAPSLEGADAPAWSANPLRRALARLLAPRTTSRSLVRATRTRGALLAGAALIPAIALGLASVQLLPMLELARFSARQPMQSFAFSDTYAMNPYSLLGLLFPYLFRAPDGFWWSLWSPWETTVYVGIVPLVLALLAVLGLRNRHTIFFAVLAPVSLLLALGSTGPFHLYEWLWQLSGLTVFRAPGRFSFAFVFAAAVLAAWGAEWLRRAFSATESRQARNEAPGSLSREIGLRAAIVLLAIGGLALMWGIGAGRAWVREHPAQVTEWVRDHYLPLPHNPALRLDPVAVYESLLADADLRNPRTVLPPVLLFALALLLLLWRWFPRAGWIWQGALVLAVGGDLAFFAVHFHPEERLSTLMASSPAQEFLAHQDPSDRVLTLTGQGAVQANRLLPRNVSTIDGYSSLQPRRQVEYSQLSRFSDSTLLDIAGVKYIVLPAEFTALPSYSGVSYHPRLPLTHGSAGNPNAQAAFAAQDFRADSVRILSAIERSVTVSQDTVAAEVTVEDTSGNLTLLTVRVGRQVSEWAYTRPDVITNVVHQRAQQAFTLPQVSPEGLRFDAQISYAELPLNRPLAVRRVFVRTTLPRGRLLVYGLALYNRATGQSTTMLLENKDSYRLAYRDADVRVYENLDALPRVFLVSRAVQATTARDALSVLVNDDFDPSTQVVLETEPGTAARPIDHSADAPVAREAALRRTHGTATVTAYSPRSVQVVTNQEEPGYLVLADAYYPGWQGIVDGKPQPIFRADYIFRAVALGPGPHSVEFRYEPPSLATGAIISLTTFGLVLLVALVVLAAAVRRRMRRPADSVPS